MDKPPDYDTVVKVNQEDTDLPSYTEAMEGGAQYREEEGVEMQEVVVHGLHRIQEEEEHIETIPSSLKEQPIGDESIKGEILTMRGQSEGTLSLREQSEEIMSLREQQSEETMSLREQSAETVV